MLHGGPLGASDWPHFRGPNRTGVVDETSGWKNGRWIAEKPDWTADVGLGSTSPVVVAGRLYTMGWNRDRDTLFCLDASTGRPIWQQSYPSPRYGRKSLGDKGLYAGPSSTPEYDPATGLLFTLSNDGELRCWNAQAGGKLVWRRNLYDDYDPPQRPRVGRSGHRDYGYTSSPLVVGDRLIVEVGAADATLIAFDKRTGRELWRSEAGGPAGHTAGPVPISVEGVACVAVLRFEGLLVTRIDDGQAGRTVATYPWKTSFANNIASVAVHGSDVLLTSAYNHYAICRLTISLDGAKKVWEQPLASKICTPVVHDGHIYWSWQNLYCLDWETGRKRWQVGGFGDAGSCIVTADDRLIVLGNRGKLVLAETARRAAVKPNVLAIRDRLLTTDAWPHVVLAGGRLFLKDRAGRLLCFSVPR